jgi:N-acetylglucosamine-6-phosphate deacetylase
MGFTVGDEIVGINAGVFFKPEEKVFNRVIDFRGGIIRNIIKPEELQQELKQHLLDFRDKVVVSGFINMHCFGAYGLSVSNIPDLRILCTRIFPAQGMTAVLPAVADPSEEILERMADFIEEQDQRDSPETRVVGIHLEGPYLQMTRGGCLKPFVRKPDLEEIKRWLAAARGHIKMVTIAPEVGGADEVIMFLHEEGVLVSFGHSDATYQEIMRMAHLANACTHWLNAMRPLEKRMEDPGLAVAALDIEHLCPMVICDDLHFRLNPFLRFLLSKKENAISVTDAVPPAGLKPNKEGYISIGGQRVRVMEDGRIVQWENPETLAGSSLTMDRAVRNTIEAGIDDRIAIAMATRNPARLLNRHDMGMIAPGMKADLTVLNADFTVFATIIGGRLAYLVKQEIPELVGAGIVK